MEEGARLPPLGDGGEQFEIALGDLVQDEMGPAVVPGQPVDVGQSVLLRVGHVGKNRARRSGRGGPVFHLHFRQVLLGNMALQKHAGPVRGGPVRAKAFAPAALAVPDKDPDQAVVGETLLDQEFAYFHPGGFGQEIVPVARLGHEELPGGDIDAGQAVTSAAKGKGSQKIVVLGLQALRFQDQTGGDDAHHVAPDHALGQFRIFDLLADRYLESPVDELGDVGGGGMVGETAQGDGVLAVLVARGQGNLQDLGSGQGVFEEHLIEVAHPEEKDAVGIAFLDFRVLPHGGGQVAYSHRPPLFCKSI